MFTKKDQSMHSLMLSLLIVMLAAVSAPVQAKTAYISDEVNVAMRSGASNQHRILKFLKSGTAFTVLGNSDDEKYFEIELADGKTGWVATENVMDTPSARDRLVSANEKLGQVRQENKELKNTAAELRADVKKLKSEINTLQNERAKLSATLEDLKVTAANPLMLRQENMQLKASLSKAEANAAGLDKENQQLRNNVAQEWFIIGGAVSLGSLIVGLILTRINWKRKRGSWGDSY
ncbi:MAG: TIGR04211 family SH3 domain-containing protein [Gammaproteobacteria bacterium]|nr:TIGR04211 family SH3 domain-containing protein [Gammaproteobacteria bacterium]